jgi:peroxiredoxin
VAQIVNTQQLINYEATIQFALGDVLRDLAILMHYAEQGQQPDTTTCTETLQHLSVFQKRLCALEQEVLAVSSTQEYNNGKALTAQN